ncbi:MAG: hypothetical protein KA792_03960 [Bacteroidales bacterium]|nr:hypothetical protein [Bacteroidales bacterium]
MLPILYQIDLTGGCYIQVELPDLSKAFTLTRRFKIGDTGLLVSEQNYPISQYIQLGAPFPAPIKLSDTGAVSQLIEMNWILIGQLQAVMFNRPDLLQPIGDNYFTATLGSGEPLIGIPGEVGPFQDIKVYYQSIYDVIDFYPHAVMKVSPKNCDSVLTLARDVVSAMTINNSIFTLPNPTLASITAEADTLQDLIAKVNSGDHSFLELRNEAAGKLYRILQDEIIYVNIIGNGTRGILELSGFPVSDPPDPKPIPPQIIIKDIKQGPSPNTIKIIIENPGMTKLNFRVQSTVTPDDENSWKDILLSTNSKDLIIKAVNPKLQYWYRVNAYNASGEGLWSLAHPFISIR